MSDKISDIVVKIFTIFVMMSLIRNANLGTNMIKYGFGELSCKRPGDSEKPTHENYFKRLF